MNANQADPIIYFLWGFILGAFCTAFLFLSLWLLWFLVAPWFKAFLSGAPISLLHLIGMRLRGSPVGLLIDTHVMLVHQQRPVDLRKLESAFIAHRGAIYSSEDLIRYVEEADAPGKGPTQSP
jgi:uncharacterized protein YqfA (UPF0365 family)